VNDAPRRGIGLAFLGCGWATRLHSRTLRSFGDVRRYYASRDAAKAAEYASRFGGAGSFASYDAALASPHVTAVLIATPPASHLDLALRAIAAGKDVIVEKPPFFTVADFDRATAAGRAAGRLVMVAENYFYKPLAEALRGIIASGDLGEVRFIHVNALKRQITGDWRDDPAMSGGGAMFEAGVHWVNFMANLGLPVDSVEAFRAGPTGGPDRSSVVVVRYANGAVGTLAQSWEIPSVLKGVRLSRVFGTSGSVTFESNGVFLLQRAGRTRLRFPGFRDMLGYRAMFHDFFEAMHERRQPRFSSALARRDLELLEAMRPSLAPRGVSAS
jgi:UDP-N-acetylglucosamine 3-dehydrogenase